MTDNKAFGADCGPLQLGMSRRTHLLLKNLAQKYHSRETEVFAETQNLVRSSAATDLGSWTR
jgi:hypothetical protein